MSRELSLGLCKQVRLTYRLIIYTISGGKSDNVMYT